MEGIFSMPHFSWQYVSVKSAMLHSLPNVSRWSGKKWKHEYSSSVFTYSCIAFVSVIRPQLTVALPLPRLYAHTKPFLDIVPLSRKLSPTCREASSQLKAQQLKSAPPESYFIAINRESWIIPSFISAARVENTTNIGELWQMTSRSAEHPKILRARFRSVLAQRLSFLNSCGVIITNGPFKGDRLTVGRLYFLHHAFHFSLHHGFTFRCFPFAISCVGKILLDIEVRPFQLF